jgi:hypothetical protein
MSKIKGDLPQTTVIYCTTNSGDKKLETKIIKTLKQNCGDLPIISVSRKPLNLGQNIRVGSVPISDSTFLKQVLKGLQAAKTKYAVLTTAEYLYPPEYFQFIPPSKTTAYRYGNVWALGDKYWKYKAVNITFAADRKYWIKKIKKAMVGHKGWKPFDLPPVFEITNDYTWTSENPVVHLITPQSTIKFSPVDKFVFPKRGLPFWGEVSLLKKSYDLC